MQWPVINNFLGIRPDVPHRRLQVIADVPDSWPGLSVRRLQVGRGHLSASATHQDGTYTTTVARAPDGWRLTLGHVLPAGAEVASVTLDGVRVLPAVRDTKRGREVHVRTTTGKRHVLVVTTK